MQGRVCYDKSVQKGCKLIRDHKCVHVSDTCRQELFGGGAFRKI